MECLIAVTENCIDFTGVPAGMSVNIRDEYRCTVEANNFMNFFSVVPSDCSCPLIHAAALFVRSSISSFPIAWWLKSTVASRYMMVSCFLIAFSLFIFFRMAFLFLICDRKFVVVPLLLPNFSILAMMSFAVFMYSFALSEYNNPSIVPKALITYSVD